MRTDKMKFSAQSKFALCARGALFAGSRTCCWQEHPRVPGRHQEKRQFQCQAADNNYNIPVLFVQIARMHQRLQYLRRKVTFECVIRIFFLKRDALSRGSRNLVIFRLFFAVAFFRREMLFTSITSMTFAIRHWNRY